MRRPEILARFALSVYFTSRTIPSYLSYYQGVFSGQTRVRRARRHEGKSPTYRPHWATYFLSTSIAFDFDLCATSLSSPNLLLCVRILLLTSTLFLDDASITTSDAVILRYSYFVISADFACLRSTSFIKFVTPLLLLLTYRLGLVYVYFFDCSLIALGPTCVTSYADVP
ncbi:hypothetical protein EDB84DRAFT_1096907 [Lactarius hengduanensis]|nr:hypothetical protein EDB84DRAFT_1096907 [Lactarius hengduanensis]